MFQVVSTVNVYKLDMTMWKELNQRRHENGCKFPMLYRDEIHTGCVYDGTMGGWGWCHDDRSNRIRCVDPAWEAESEVRGAEGCTFPFLYRNRKHNECACEETSSSETSSCVCSLTPNADRDGMLTKCHKKSSSNCLDFLVKYFYTLCKFINLFIF